MHRSLLILALWTVSATAQEPAPPPERSTIRLLLDDEVVPVEVRRAVATDDGWLVVGTTRADEPETVIVGLDRDLGFVRATEFSSILPGTALTDFAHPITGAGGPFLAVHYEGTGQGSDRIAVFQAAWGEFVGQLQANALTRVDVADALGPGRRVSHLAAVRQLPCEPGELCPFLIVGTSVAEDDPTNEDPFAIVARQSLRPEPRSLLAPTPGVRDGLLAAEVGADGRVVLGGYARRGAAPDGPLDLQFHMLDADLIPTGSPARLAQPTEGGPLRIAEIVVGPGAPTFVVSAELDNGGQRTAVVVTGAMTDGGLQLQRVLAGWPIPGVASAVRAARVVRPEAGAPFVVTIGEDASGLHVLMAIDRERGSADGGLVALGDVVGLESLAVSADGRRHLEGAPAQDGGTQLWVRDLTGVIPSASGSAPTAPAAPAGEQAVLTLDDGAQYEGEVRDGQPHGIGVATFPNGNRYEGTWANGRMHGTGTFTYADGETYIGTFAEGRIEGRGRTTFADGTVHEGAYRDGLWSGEGTITFANGDRYAGTFADGQMSGNGTYAWPNGAVYRGAFAEHAPHGRGRKWYSDGAVCEGDFARWNRHGTVRCVLANGDVFEGTYVDDIADAGLYTFPGQAPRPARWTGDEWVWTGPPALPPPGCDALVLDLDVGTLNGLGPAASRDALRQQLPCATGSTPDGSPINRGGGVFFLNHRFFFYTHSDFLEVRSGFRGTVRPAVLGAALDDAGLGTPSRTIDGTHLFDRAYGCLRVKAEAGSVTEIGVHAQPCTNVRVSW